MKSHVSVLLELAIHIYKDAVFACAAEISKRDLKTIRSRVKDEGVSFLTITLPSFSSDFERSLENGSVDPSLFREFRKSGAIPAFLQGMLGRVFDRDTGRINDVKIHNSPDDVARSVASIRQFCLAFKKIELPCTSERTKRALLGFIDIERSFEMFTLSGEDRDEFRLVSSMLWSNILGDFCHNELLPRHGPGATSERVSGNQKYAWRFWHERLEPFLPILGNAVPIYCERNSVPGGGFEDVEFLSEELEIPVRVTPVPKTLKGPRIIAIEPCCMQYAQQGIRTFIYDRIESHWMTSGHVNFRDQSVNQSFAISASRDQSFATIDLSEASDRVPLSLALTMFEDLPDLRDSILACRSSSAQMPDGTIVGPLRKFASMGSALCFPIEAMYFYTICVVASLKGRDLPVTYSSLRKVAKDVYVYGDDILVPTDIAATVLDYLRKYNCKVNSRKTFYRGFFRESCGVDAYLGYEVQPSYVGTLLPKNRQQSREFISSVETARQLFSKGYFNSSEFLFNQVERVFGPLPESSSDSPVIGRNHFCRNVKLKTRFNKSTQQVEKRCWVPSPVYYTDTLEGSAALMKCLLKLEGLVPLEPYKLRGKSPSDWAINYVNSLAMVDPKHLERSARHGVVTVKLRWVPLFQI